MPKELIWSATKKDFHVDWFSGTGAGGQYRSKHQNCCRITHIESGLVATGQDHRDRPSNQRDAFNKLAEMLVDYYKLRDSRIQVEISNETIRTYHEPRNDVKDHASNLRQEYKYVVEAANIGEMIEERMKTREK